MSDGGMYTISNAAMAAIRRAAGPVFDSRAVRLPDGSWRVAFSDETVERAKAHAIAGETLSDTIVRLCDRFGNGGRLN